MHPVLERFRLDRRRLLTTAAGGIGAVALATMLREDGTRTAAPKAPAIVPKAKRCVFIFMEGGPSQIDLFQPKPTLNEMNGKPVDPRYLGGQFAFIRKDNAVWMRSPRRFKRHGESGMWFSDLLPNIARHADKICMLNTVTTDQFNHHPAQLVMQTGNNLEGHPAMGSWLGYGSAVYGLLGGNKNFPDYVVMNCSPGLFGGATLWQSGFLPSSYGGILLNARGSPIYDLATPRGLSAAVERATLDHIEKANDLCRKKTMDPEIDVRTTNYELAFRMEGEAAKLLDLSGEQKSLERYGANRSDPSLSNYLMPGGYGLFARQCLSARRLLESGVRFVNLFAGAWDHHNTVNKNLPLLAGMVDQPIAALIQDLDERGLLADTLVVWGSEFGRTPIAEIRPEPGYIPGRDHHPYAFNMFMLGGGVKGGTVVGETDDYGWAAKDKGNPSRDQSVDVSDVHATILHLFGIDHMALSYPYHGVNMRLTPLTRRARVLDTSYAPGVLAAAI